MKRLIGCIVLLSLMQCANAQHKTTHKRAAKQKATTENPAAAKRKMTTIIFFHSLKDAVSSSLSNSIDSFFADHAAFQIIRINIPQRPDSVPAEEWLQRFADDFTNDLFADAGNKHVVPISNNMIVTGENEGAVVALYCAAANPRKLRRTGMFIYKYDPFTQLKNLADSIQLPVSGKLFIYNRKENAEDVGADNFCDVAAMNEDLLLFKADEDAGKMPANVFTEFINWVTAEGSNYVVKIE